MALTKSEQMARVRNRDTAAELTLRSALWHAGLRYRLSAPKLCAKPDLVFPRQRIAVFVDGCFWHGCPQHYTLPKSRPEFWTAKLTDNVSRDRRQTASLRKEGWTVLRFWEHELRSSLHEVLATIRSSLEGERRYNNSGWRVEFVEALGPDARREHFHLVTLWEPVQRRLEVRQRDKHPG